VSGCKYYLFREQQPNGERCCGMGLVDCNGNDCLYKKYKRKEQECEELKNFHINLVGVKECEIKELAELKAENKHLNDLLNQALKELEKTREILAEIKEIAEILAPMTEEYENCLDRDRCFECDFTEYCSYFNIKQILQKIIEVLDVENN
jgi:hypothetical protein